MYGDVITKSMKNAIDETNRRREIQMAYNKKHNITPKTIIKDIQKTVLISTRLGEEKQISKEEKEKLILNLEKELEKAVKELDFESAITLRDQILELKGVRKK